MARSVSMSSPDVVSSDPSIARFLTTRSVLNGLFRVIVGSLTLLAFVSPSSVLAQYTEAKIGEYLNYAVAATNAVFMPDITRLAMQDRLSTPLP